MPIECIDAHHHLWRYSAAEYPWIADEQSDEMDVLRRDYLPSDLATVAIAAGVTGTVAMLLLDEIGIDSRLYAGGYSDWVSYSENKVVQGEN